MQVLERSASDHRLSLEVYLDPNFLGPDYLSDLPVLYQSPRTIIYYDSSLGLVLKQQQVRYNASQAPNHHEIVVEARDITEQEAIFFSNEFPVYTPKFAVVTGIGNQGVETVFTVQEFVSGPTLAEVKLKPKDSTLRPFWKRVLDVYDYNFDHRFPDLQADTPIHLLGKNLPDPFHTVNVILSPKGPMLVDVEERVGHWSHKTMFGRFAVCPMIKEIIQRGIK